MSSKTVKVLWARRLNYRTGLMLQSVIEDRHHTQQSINSDTLIVCEHEPVYTVGIRDKSYTPEVETKLKSLGAEFYRTNRGGLITFHGPGQLVAYPVVNLRNFETNIRCYVSRIEKMIIRLCAEFGIKGETSPHTGVWVNDRKICAIGIHASRYVTTHGLALNCNTDLEWFEHIVPCGIKGKEVTSISRELATDVTVEEILPFLIRAFSDEFQCSIDYFSEGEVSQVLRKIKAIEKEKPQ